jgi:phosphoribosylamine--glycine ligase
MRILVLGSGAKEHAVAWWLSRSHFIDALFVAPGNIGTDTFAVNLNINPADFAQVYDVCQKHAIEYVMIGTEEPLFAGMIDKLNEKGIQTFGTPTAALKMEGDRDFSRAFTDRHKHPHPDTLPVPG